MARAHAAPLRLHPKNPRYFLFRGPVDRAPDGGRALRSGRQPRLRPRPLSRGNPVVRLQPDAPLHGLVRRRQRTGLARDRRSAQPRLDSRIGPTSLSHFRQNATATHSVAPPREGDSSQSPTEGRSIRGRTRAIDAPNASRRVAHADASTSWPARGRRATFQSSQPPLLHKRFPECRERHTPAVEPATSGVTGRAGVSACAASCR